MGLGFEAHQARAMLQQSIAQVGSKAHALLRTETRGRVLAAFGQVIYLATDSGDLLWIASSPLPMHARCLRIAGPLPEVRLGDSFGIRRGRVVLDSSASFDFSAASLWTAEPLPKRPRTELRWVLERARGHAALLLEGAPGAGFGLILPQILERSGMELQNPLQVHDPSLERALPTLRVMMGAYASHQPDQLLAHAADLIGLGPGLTPSGDDFLGGFLFGLSQLSKVYPAVLPLSDLGSLMGLAKQWTNLISSTLLLDMASGIAVEPAHTWANTLIADGPESRALDAVRRLTRLGHSTGWDIFTGLLLSIVLSDRQVRPERTATRSAALPDRIPAPREYAHGNQAED